MILHFVLCLPVFAAQILAFLAILGMTWFRYVTVIIESLFPHSSFDESNLYRSVSNN
jgi:hypothetical protein